MQFLTRLRVPALAASVLLATSLSAAAQDIGSYGGYGGFGGKDPNTSFVPGNLENKPGAIQHPGRPGNGNGRPGHGGGHGGGNGSGGAFGDLSDGIGDWTAMLIAGSHQDRQGNSTMLYDNAHSQMEQALEGLGIRQRERVIASAQPNRFRGSEVTGAGLRNLRSRFSDVVRDQRPEGCFVFLTTSNNPDPIGRLQLGGDTIDGADLDQLLQDTCGDRPTFVAISACGSGRFLNSAAMRPNRILFTSSERGRATDSCFPGGYDILPFDRCLIEALDSGSSFADVIDDTQDCVAHEERRQNVNRRSEPTANVGSDWGRQFRRFRL